MGPFNPFEMANMKGENNRPLGIVESGEEGLFQEHQEGNAGVLAKAFEIMTDLAKEK